MPEKVSYNKEDGYSFVKSIGNVSVCEWEYSVSQLLTIKQNKGINRVLVDTTEQVKTSSTNAVFEFAQKLPKDIYFALLIEDVNYSPKTTEPTQRFLEAIGNELGVNIRSFTEKLKPCIG